MVDQTLKLEFEDYLDSLERVCDVAVRGPDALSSYLMPGALGSFIKRNASKSLKNSSHRTTLISSWMVDEDQLMDGVGQKMMPSVFPSPNASLFVLQPPVSHGGEDVERVEDNNSVFCLDGRCRYLQTSYVGNQDYGISDD
ncbi:hypothetical protein L873DRAFT_1841606 [Choiromyces venosus 120613-1]|uniref:Uncharacterized protein n=1 Tax=Choiromyces venosus 120613-1 TaxID=1336337 RepID=A0A3N4K2U3_9PEZI|nr:hypothetical protein L873DRAFT_1841606 [Choiromyces venosus 120613-1]